MKRFILSLLAVTIPTAYLLAQLPQNIDAGTGDDAIPVWENPKYIIVIVVILAFVILGFWIRRRR